MKQKIISFKLSIPATANQYYGATAGKLAFQELSALMDAHSGAQAFGISLEGIDYLDGCFARESIIKLAILKRGRQGIFLSNLVSTDVLDNIDYAAQAMGQPITVWEGKQARFIGPSMGSATIVLIGALQGLLRTNTAQIAQTLGISIPNASTRLKRLVEQGYLLREEAAAKSGGIEHWYAIIGEPQA
jgi:hypothetical protein